MSITREMALSGRIVLRLDELDRIKEVRAYNGRLWELRRGMRRLKELRFGIYVLNTLMLLAMLVTCGDSIFGNVWLAVAILFIFLTGYTYSLSKSAEPVLTAVSALLLLLDIRFGILLAANTVLSFMIWKTEKPLKNEVGYPLFNEIELLFEEQLR